MSIKLNADEVKADLEKRARERAERAERMRLAEEEKNRVPAPPTTPNKKESLHRRFRSLRDTLGEDHPDTLKVKVQLHERHLSRKVVVSNASLLRKSNCCAFRPLRRIQKSTSKQSQKFVTWCVTLSVSTPYVHLASLRLLTSASHPLMAI